MKSKPTTVTVQSGKAKPVSILYFGRKAPKGWREVCAIHLGKGFWMLRIEKVI
jgi:hypothetical protein